MEPYLRKDRKLSRFFARQMLYEFYTGELDETRTKAVKVSLEEDADLQRELNSIEKADKYCLTLQGTRINPEFIFELSKEKSYIEHVDKFLTWKRWPEMARWTVEALAVSAVVVAFIVFVPWQGMLEGLSRQRAKLNTSPISIPGLSPDTKKSDEENRLANIEVEAIEKSIELENSDEPVAKAPPEPEKKSEAPTKVVATTTIVPTTIPPAVTAPAKAVALAPTTKKPVTQGLLYRMMMSVDEIGQKTPGLKRRIQDMGGVKAGNVELGWRKPNGNYFHFAFPEARYQTLVDVLSEYGPVKVYKSAHERVMPEGQIRVILWIEDAVTPVNPVPTSGEGAVGEIAPATESEALPTEPSPTGNTEK